MGLVKAVICTNDLKWLQSCDQLVFLSLQCVYMAVGRQSCRKVLDVVLGGVELGKVFHRYTMVIVEHGYLGRHV
jgi:hypothetical protein